MQGKNGRKAGESMKTYQIKKYKVSANMDIEAATPREAEKIVEGILDGCQEVKGIGIIKARKRVRA